MRPLFHADGALHVLDQRRLPGEEVWLRCTTVEEVAVAIETLAVRGAPAIGVAAAYGASFGDDLEQAVERLRSTRPTAVNLVHALDQVLASDDPLATAQAIEQREIDATELIAAHGRELGIEGRVITHCNAGSLACLGVGTALGVIRASEPEHVWVPETRPLLQGARLTAYELAADGIAHDVVTDSSAGHLMSRDLVDAAVVGADRIAANGDVANKIGTYTLAVLAARHGVPFYVAAPTSTIDTTARTGADIPIEERAPDELGGAARARNWAFDVTPNDLVTAIVTEQGVFRGPYAF